GQEEQRRAGTENVPGIVGLGRAAELSMEWLARPGATAELARLRDRLESGLLERVPTTFVHAGEVDRVPNTTNLRFDGVSGEALLVMLSHESVCVSTGSACASRSQTPSHI